MKALARLGAALLAAMIVIVAWSAPSVRADAFARWDRVDGRGSWTTGWIRQTPAQYGANINRCGHFHSACRCPGKGSYCGWYNNGSVTGWWIGGCNNRPWTIRCTVRPHVASVPSAACVQNCSYQRQRCLAPGAAFAARCNSEYNGCMNRCRGG